METKKHLIIAGTSILTCLIILIILGVGLRSISLEAKNLDEAESGVEAFYNVVETGQIPDDPAFKGKLETTIDIISNLYKTIIITGIIAPLLILFLLIISRAYIWSKVLNQKLDKKFFTRFLCLSLIWHIPWILLIVLSLIILKSEIKIYIASILLVVYLITTYVLLSSFKKDKKYLDMIKHAFKLCFTKIHRIILPFIISLAIIAVYAFIYYLIVFKLPLPSFLRTVFFTLKIVIPTLFIFILSSWIRIFIEKEISKLRL